MSLRHSQHHKRAERNCIYRAFSGVDVRKTREIRQRRHLKAEYRHPLRRRLNPFPKLPSKFRYSAGKGRTSGIFCRETRRPISRPQSRKKECLPRNALGQFGPHAEHRQKSRTTNASHQNPPCRRHRRRTCGHRPKKCSAANGKLRSKPNLQLLGKNRKSRRSCGCRGMKIGQSGRPGGT